MSLLGFHPDETTSGDLDKASNVLPSIPKEHHISVAHFLESRGMIDEALEVATDPDYRFELAIQLGYCTSSIKTLQLEMAEDCLKRANYLSGLLLLYSSLGDAEEIEKLALVAKDPDAWVVALSKNLSLWWPWVVEGDFPLTTTKGVEMETYKELDPTIRLVILKELCETVCFRNVKQNVLMERDVERISKKDVFGRVNSHSLPPTGKGGVCFTGLADPIPEFTWCNLVPCYWSRCDALTLPFQLSTHQV
ncbi:unnamed protein product [Lactuca virosa]|uniref:COPA/B TPR domain-containing protein n=1 Tax=Lactuca virosa TaxID=75947 RepID=A0AAU9P9L6_9ASTR|nr:unnamed protein product [Lactuca virosa]